MAITSTKINKLHDSFLFLRLDYYKENGKYREVISFHDMENTPFLALEGEISYTLELSDYDLNSMQELSLCCKNTLEDAKDEILSNVYSISETDRLHYLDGYKMDFYSVCRIIHHVFYEKKLLHSIRLNNLNYIELKEHERGIIDEYIESVSSLAYRWCYHLHSIEKRIRGCNPLQEVSMPRKGTRLREDIIFNLLFAYDYDMFENKINFIEHDDFIDYEVHFKEKDWISFSDGALNRFLYNKEALAGDNINWLFKGRKKNESPNILKLVIFSLTLIHQKILSEFSNNKSLANYIAQRITLEGKKFTMDVSNISKANKIMLKNNITHENIECHLHQ